MLGTFLLLSSPSLLSPSLCEARLTEKPPALHATIWSGIRMENNYLVPPTGPVALHRSDSGVAMVELHRDNSVQVMKQLLDGMSRHIHAGVGRIHLPRRNVLITMRSNGKDLEKIRVVMLDYSLSPIWSHKKRATVPNCRKNVVEELPRPPHPAQCFGIWGYPEFSGVNVLPEFCGWLSDGPIWDSHLAVFKRWLVSKEGFLETLQHHLLQLGNVRAAPRGETDGVATGQGAENQRSPS